MTRSRVLVAAAAALLGIAAADAARRAPGFSLAGDSVALLALGVVAGWATVVAGLALGAGGSRLSGGLLASAGCAWLAAGLDTPGARGAAPFTLGLVLAAATPALIGHMVLVAMRDRLPRLDRALVGALYASLIGALGLLPALFFDAAAEGCGTCPANLLAVTDAPVLAADLSRWGVRLALVATACTIALALWRLARAPAARLLRAAALVVPGCAYLALVDIDLGHALQRGFLGSDPVDQALWTGQAVALLVVALGVAWSLAAARRRRSRLARVVLGLADAQRPGGLRDALTELLGDPDLDLLYAGTAGGWIDAAGQVRAPLPHAATTELIRDGQPVALLCHRPELLDDRRLAGEIERGVRLGLEHERLQSQLRHQLEDLRRSRADVVATAEAERRLLERDLHDGAQQQLVAFAFALGIARQHAAPERSAALASAQREVHAALAELRELAHGLYPVALADDGLASAIESLKDRRPGLRTNGLPADRFRPAIEETAYFAIARLADDWAPQPLALAAARDGQRLIIDLRASACPPADLVDIEDRVGALGGTLVVNEESSDDTHVTVELPCA